MSHVQQQILDALQALIIAGNTLAQGDVFVDRIDPLAKGMRHAIFIREGENGEAIQPGSIKDLQRRDLEVVIDCALKRREGAAAAARDFALSVEKIVSPRIGNTTLLALCTDWGLRDSRLTQMGDGDEAVASRELTYIFTYHVRKGAPDVSTQST